MVKEAVRLGALSVDHLEATTIEDAEMLAQSETFAVGLPCTGLHLSKPTGGEYANLRRLVDFGAKVAIATNFNPGSSPTMSMPLAIAAAARFCGLTPQEAITACTINAASLLGLKDRGFIAPGARADLILLKHTDERMLAYEMGGDPVDAI
ncbi:amidohydrolase family protein, partial [Limnofasciculus baicalensis]